MDKTTLKSATTSGAVSLTPATITDRMRIICKAHPEWGVFFFERAYSTDMWEIVRYNRKDRKILNSGELKFWMPIQKTMLSHEMGAWGDTCVYEIHADTYEQAELVAKAEGLEINSIDLKDDKWIARKYTSIGD